MGYSDCVIAIAYGGEHGSELATAWLRRLALESDGARLLSTYETRRSRAMRRALIEVYAEVTNV